MALARPDEAARCGIRPDAAELSAQAAISWPNTAPAGRIVAGAVGGGTVGVESQIALAGCGVGVIRAAGKEVRSGCFAARRQRGG